MSPTICSDKPLLTLCLTEYNNWVAENIDAPVRSVMNMRPTELVDLFKDIKDLTIKLPNSFRNNEPIPVSVNDDELSYLKRAILHTLNERSIESERLSALTNDRDLKNRLESEVDEIVELTKKDWFSNIDAIRSPKLTDFLTLEQATRFFNKPLAERQYDEKFHILNAPTLFILDISHYRAACSLRGKSITVAFLDIDDFKNFNSEHGETTVDRDVLPKFMSALEACVFSNGHAYRFGGDEYVLLLPNVPIKRACDIISEFQMQLKKIEYYNIDSRPTVSVGLIEANEDSILTDQQCLTMAERAKNEAKKVEKGCIVINKGEFIADNEFEKYAQSMGETG